MVKFDSSARYVVALIKKPRPRERSTYQVVKNAVLKGIEGSDILRKYRCFCSKSIINDIDYFVSVPTHLNSELERTKHRGIHLPVRNPKSNQSVEQFADLH